MVHSIFYVSKSVLPLPRADAEVQAIVDWSRAWNDSVGITGALVFTQRHFAQFFEGPTEPVIDLIGKIRRDQRHTGVTVIQERDAEARRFDGWSLVYSGPELFLEPQILPLITRGPGGDVDAPAEELIQLMQEFTRQGGT